MPDVNALQGVAEFGDKPNVSVRATSAAELMAQLGKAFQSGKSHASSVATGEGLPALPKRLVDKIIAGDYVDFSELPPAKGKSKGPSQALEGQVVVIQAAELMSSRKIIPDLATWSQCFNLFAAVVVKQQPERARSLFAYSSLIARCSAKYGWPSWIVYDQNFRQEAAESGNLDWAKVDPSIYTQCFTGATQMSAEGWCRRCQSVDHLTENCPSKPGPSSAGYSAGYANSSRKFPLPLAGRKRSAPQSIPEVCKKYNKYDGDCRFGDNCIFQHKCGNCGEPNHPVTQCQKPKKKLMQQ